MNRLLSFLIFFTLTGSLAAQNTFPDSWVGNYKGDLLIYGKDTVAMKVEMRLDIAKTEKDSVYNWTLTYDPKGRNDKRAYQLVVIDKEKGHYQIDEKNSIILDAYLKNSNILTSFFEVNKNYIITTETMQEDGTILFEVISGNASKPNTTGKSIHQGKEIPEVFSYLVNGRQKATLRKQ